jgi:hypothetical protein
MHAVVLQTVCLTVRGQAYSRSAHAAQQQPWPLSVAGVPLLLVHSLDCCRKPCNVPWQKWLLCLNKLCQTRCKGAVLPVCVDVRGRGLV